MIRNFLIFLMFLSPFLGIAQSIVVNRVENYKGLFFTVQLGTVSSSETPGQYTVFEEINRESLDNGKFRYSTGLFPNLNDARKALESIQSKGFDGAFVIAYENGTRVSLRTVRERESSAIRIPQKQQKITSQSPPDAQKAQRQFDDRAYDETIREVKDLFENQILDYQPSQIRIDSSLPIYLMEKRFDTLLDTEIDSLALNAQIKRLRGDIGLETDAYFNRNFSPGFVETEDLFYLQRLNLGLNLNLLANGYAANKLKAQELENDLRIQKLQRGKLTVKRTYEDAYNHIIYLFNVKKLELVDERISLLNRQLQIAEMLYTTKNKSWEDIIGLKANKKRAESMYTKWSQYNNVMRSKIFTSQGVLDYINVEGLPVLKINAMQLFAFSGDSTFVDEEIIALKKANIDLKYNRSNDIRLAPFARYSFIAQDEAFDRSFSSVGMRLSVPIKWGNHHELKAYEKLQVQAIEGQAQRNDKHQLLNYYYEYEYKFEQLIEFYFTRKKIQERLRKEIIKYQLNDERFSPLKAIRIWMNSMQIN